MQCYSSGQTDLKALERVGAFAAKPEGRLDTATASLLYRIDRYSLS